MGEFQYPSSFQINETRLIIDICPDIVREFGEKLGALLQPGGGQSNKFGSHDIREYPSFFALTAKATFLTLAESLYKE